jgi:DNA mismatch repair protein MSH4
MEFCSDSAGRMNIDRRTAINLELVNNAQDGNQKQSLFGAINFTKTTVGARLLRSNILRPSTDVATIEMRLDAVGILLT